MTRQSARCHVEALAAIDALAARQAPEASDED